MHRLLIYYRWALYFLLAFFVYLMLRITIPYFSLDHKEGFLAIKQQVIGNDTWRWSFFVHVFSSCFLLLAGFTQFSGFILRKYKLLHRNMGKMYVFILLFLSGPAGLIMALYANGGLYSRIGFTLLSLLWLLFTALGWYYAVKKDFALHRQFMIRSFALTVSALTLRLWKLVIVLSFHPAPMDAYRIVAWLGWVPNLLVAEWIIRKYEIRNMKSEKP